MLNIVLFGAPGCGKGTQASRLREHYGINHVSTGEVIRAEIARGTELGRSMEEYIKSGRLAPDAVVIGMIANYVAEHRDAAGNIFDGFPRTTIQAEEFDKILGGHGLGVTLMVDMHVPEEELVRRISAEKARAVPTMRRRMSSATASRSIASRPKWSVPTTPGRTNISRSTASARWTRSSTGSVGWWMRTDDFFEGRTV